MCSALFSIKPIFADKIFSGEKQFEFRRRGCRRKISRMIIYETAPVSMIVGEAAVLDVIRASPVALWERTKQFAGISWEAFELYFLHQPEAFAYSLAAPVLYSSPILLSSIGIATPPQSYCYISQEIYEDVILPRIER